MRGTGVRYLLLVVVAGLVLPGSAASADPVGHSPVRTELTVDRARWADVRFDMSAYNPWGGGLEIFDPWVCPEGQRVVEHSATRREILTQYGCGERFEVYEFDPVRGAYLSATIPQKIERRIEVRREGRWRVASRSERSTRAVIALRWTPRGNPAPVVGLTLPGCYFPPGCTHASLRWSQQAVVTGVIDLRGLDLRARAPKGLGGSILYG